MNSLKQSAPHIRPIPSLILNALQTTHQTSLMNQNPLQSTQQSPPISPKKASILATNLIKSYFEKGSVKEARQLFDEMPERDVVAWTAMIAGYTSCNRDPLAWMVFCEMLREGVRPNAYTVSSVLKGCKGMKCYSCGAAVHGVAVKHGLVGSIYVDNALMDVYAACCRTMDEASMVFGGVEVKSDASWTTLMAGYTHRGDGYGGLRVFRQMLSEEAKPSTFSFSIAVKACSSTGQTGDGEQLHAAIIKYGFASSLPVMNSIVDMYCWCQKLSEARQCFSDMRLKDLITWNTLIAGYKRLDSNECLTVFSSMESQGFTPNCFTFTTVAAACADLALLHCGQQIHAGIIRRGLDTNMALANSLIDMYAKCGSISDSRKIFEAMASRDLVSWTSMMIGYGTHGYGKEAVELFEEMIRSGIRPDRVVFMAVLSACSHAGLVSEGLRYFNSMLTVYNIVPDQDIYGCVVDLLGRAGKVEAAYDIVKNMAVDPNDGVWGALLGSCKAHMLPHLGKLAAQFMLDTRPDMVRTYLVLSNLYASEGEWGDFARMRNLMKGLGGKKEPGCSWIELKNDIYSFVVGDNVGPHMDGVYEILNIIIRHMKEACSFPDVDFEEDVVRIEDMY